MSDAAQNPPEKPPVEKPKRNWRGFLKEYAVIVIGVLTALAAEQTAQWVNWQSEVRAARRAISAEMMFNNTGFFALRMALAPCIDRQINETQAIITALEAGQKPQSLAGFRTGLHALISDAEWQSERSSQVLTHFPREELALMSSYYSQLPNFEEWLGIEGAAWHELSILQNIPAAISAPEINRLRVNLLIARRMEYLIERNARRELGVSNQIGLPEAVADPKRVKTYCSRMSLDDWWRWQNANQTGLPPSTSAGIP